MKKLFTLTTSLVVALAVILVFSSTPVEAVDWSLRNGVEAAQGSGVPTNLFGDAGIVTTATNFLLFIAGALAVIMLIWGGLRYTVSGGNASSVTAAKNTVLYAIVGLIVAFLAFAAVNFVLSAIVPGGSAGFTNT